MQPPSSPIVVRVVEEPLRGFGLGDVLIRAIGLTGALTLGAVLCGLLLAGLFIGYQKLKVRWSPELPASDTQLLGLTRPTPR